jgi:cellobiose transport system permease protein
MTLHLDTRPARDSARAGPARMPVRARMARLDIKGSPYLYVAPFFVIFLAFLAFPMVYTLYVSTRDWPLGATTSTGLGFANFTELVKDTQFWNSVKNTFGIFVLSTVPQLLTALGLANLLNRRLRWRAFFRMGMIVPIATSTVVIGLLFNQIFSRDFGIVNWLFGEVGIHKVDWKADWWSSWLALATMVNWRWTGYNALIYLAAMQAIPRDLYESAAIDGANGWTQFWRITVPLLRPTIVFTVIISTIGGLQLFGEPMTFGTGADSFTGGTLHQYQTVTMYLWEVMFSRYRLGYAGAVAWVLFLLILVTSIINYLVIRRFNRGAQ